MCIRDRPRVIISNILTNSKTNIRKIRFGHMYSDRFKWYNIKQRELLSLDCVNSTYNNFKFCLMLIACYFTCDLTDSRLNFMRKNVHNNNNRTSLKQSFTLRRQHVHYRCTVIWDGRQTIRAQLGDMLQYWKNMFNYHIL